MDVFLFKEYLNFISFRTDVMITYICILVPESCIQVIETTTDQPEKWVGLLENSRQLYSKLYEYLLGKRSYLRIQCTCSRQTELYTWCNPIFFETYLLLLRLSVSHFENGVSSIIVSLNKTIARLSIMLFTYINTYTISNVILFLKYVLPTIVNCVRTNAICPKELTRGDRTF